MIWGKENLPFALSITMSRNKMTMFLRYPHCATWSMYIRLQWMTMYTVLSALLTKLQTPYTITSKNCTVYTDEWSTHAVALRIHALIPKKLELESAILPPLFYIILDHSLLSRSDRRNLLVHVTLSSGDGGPISFFLPHILCETHLSFLRKPDNAFRPPTGHLLACHVDSRDGGGRSMLGQDGWFQSACDVSFNRPTAWMAKHSKKCANIY
jgi:hypothetical protein